MRHFRSLRRHSAAGLALAAGAALMAGLWACSSDESNYGTGPGTRELSSGTIPLGGVFQHTFASAGTFPYRCTLHSCMTGALVTVGGSGLDSAVVNIVNGGSGCDGAFSPASVSVKPGRYVRWVNQDQDHTVTSP